MIATGDGAAEAARDHIKPARAAAEGAERNAPHLAAPLNGHDA
jgi:hypothetical protein